MGNDLKKKNSPLPVIVFRLINFPFFGLALFPRGDLLIFSDEDPVLAKNRIRGSVPQTKGDFKKSIE